MKSLILFCITIMTSSSFASNSECGLSQLPGVKMTLSYHRSGCLPGSATGAAPGCGDYTNIEADQLQLYGENHMRAQGRIVLSVALGQCNYFVGGGGLQSKKGCDVQLCVH